MAQVQRPGDLPADEPDRMFKLSHALPALMLIAKDREINRGNLQVPGKLAARYRYEPDSRVIQVFDNDPGNYLPDGVGDSFLTMMHTVPLYHTTGDCKEYAIDLRPVTARLKL